VLEQLPPWGNLAVFAIAAAMVWMAGTRIARYVDAIAEATGIGRGAGPGAARSAHTWAA